MSIQTVEIALPTGIDSVSVGLAEPVSIVEVRQGPAGPAGSAVINAATQSDGTAALYLDSIRFEATNGGPTQLGEMAWESNDGSIDAMLESGVIVAMGEDLVIRVRNTTASPITKGTALAYDGTSGASGRIEVKPWVGANIPTAKLFLGFSACDMPANSNGYSQWFGKLTEINTSGGGQTWLDEQIIYAVPGASATLTNVAPTSGEYAAAAVVINAGSGTSGILFVRPTFEVASSTSATANTLVLRDANGGASFGPLSALAGSSNQHSITSSAGTNIVGPLALSGSTGDTLTATYNAAITLNSTTGVNVNGGPLSLTQTWNDAAVTFTGLQVNVTDTASNAASLLMDLRVGGSTRFSISKNGALAFGSSTNPVLRASVASDGAGRLLLNASNIGGATLYGSLGIGGNNDTILHRDGASGTLAQRNGNAAQESRIYGTYSGAGDYRRLALKMSSTGVAQIVAEGAGSGASANRLEFVTGGATRMTVAADGNITTSGSITGTGALTLAGGGTAQNITLVPSTTGVVEQRNGTTKQKSHVYQSFTSTSNYMRVAIDTDLYGAGLMGCVIQAAGASDAGAPTMFVGSDASGGQFAIRAGGSTRWRVNGSGHFLAQTDNTIDIGASGATRPRDFYLGRNATIGGTLAVTGASTFSTIQTGGYLFANLPSPATQGMRAYITDGADIPLYMANAAGGGSTVTPVFYNGVNWINA